MQRRFVSIDLQKISQSERQNLLEILAKMKSSLSAKGYRLNIRKIDSEPLKK